jgi:hypothetical protein
MQSNIHLILERYWNLNIFFIHIYGHLVNSRLKIKIFGSAAGVVLLRERWFCSCARYMTGGSRVLHGIWPVVLEFCTACDRWFYSFARHMTGGSTVLHGIWPVDLQFCTAYDRWFYTLVLCMTDVLQFCTVYDWRFYSCARRVTDGSTVVVWFMTAGSTVVHTVWSMVLQLCTVYGQYFYISAQCTKLCLLILFPFALLI